MISVEITEDQIKRAKELYDFEALKGSITKGGGNLVGAIGEIVVLDHYGAKYVGNYDYDLTIGSFKVDVKTTKSVGVPKPFYKCMLSDYNTKQKTEYYCFVRVDMINKKAYILGFMGKSEFLQRAEFHKKGDVNPNSKKKFAYRSDCWSVTISDLYDLHS